MMKLKTLAAALTLAGLAGTGAAANDVSLTPGNTSLMPGQTVVLSIGGTGFADLMLGGGLSFSWNPDVVDLTSISINGSNWEFARDTGLHDPASGTLSGMYFASFAGRTGDFAIGSLTFTADGPGTTMVAMSLYPTQPFANELGDVVAVSLHNAGITVAVPEPGTWALFALGGGLLPLLRRRIAR